MIYNLKISLYSEENKSYPLTFMQGIYFNGLPSVDQINSQAKVWGWINLDNEAYEVLSSGSAIHKSTDQTKIPNHVWFIELIKVDVINVY